MIRFILTASLIWAIGFFYFITPDKPANTTTQAIVVLTGGSGRVEEGFRLLKEKKAPKLFISGVHEDVTCDELSPDITLNERVFLGHKATTTRENALETKEWIKEHNVKSIRLITAHYHMHRSLLEYKRVMPTLTIIPHAIIPTLFKKGWWTTKKTMSLALTEYNKFLMAYVLMYVEETCHIHLLNKLDAIL